MIDAGARSALIAWGDGPTNQRLSTDCDGGKVGAAGIGGVERCRAGYITFPAERELDESSSVHCMVQAFWGARRCSATQGVAYRVGGWVGGNWLPPFIGYCEAVGDQIFVNLYFQVRGAGVIIGLSRRVRNCLWVRRCTATQSIAYRRECGNWLSLAGDWWGLLGAWLGRAWGLTAQLLPVGTGIRWRLGGVVSI